jgi:hypothetical protein
VISGTQSSLIWDDSGSVGHYQLRIWNKELECEKDTLSVKSDLKMNIPPIPGIS